MRLRFHRVRGGRRYVTFSPDAADYCLDGSAAFFSLELCFRFGYGGYEQVSAFFSPVLPFMQ